MAAEPSTSKWNDLEANRALRELAEGHHAALLRNISKRKRKANNGGSPTQPLTQRKKKVKNIAPPESEPTPSPLISNPTPSPKKGSRSRPNHNATYTFNRDKLPGLVSRAKEFVKKWHEPKLPKDSHEAKKSKYRAACNIYTINHSKGVVDFVKPTNPLYIAMEFRKSLIRHDWAGVKKLLKVFLRSSNKLDRITWKMILTTLFYYPGAEAALREFLERNRMSFAGSALLRGLLEINGMERFSIRQSTKGGPEFAPSAANEAEVFVSDDGDDSK